MGVLGTQYEVDLLVRDRAGRPVAAVELKNRQTLTREIAMQLRRNLLAHDVPGDVPYFLLLSQDVGYLWRATDAPDGLAPPSREFPMQAVMARYAGRARASERLRKAEFASIVFRWLQALTRAAGEARDEPERALQGVGLVDAMRGGSITHQTGV